MKHNFVVRWEDKHFKNRIKSFPTNTMVSIVHLKCKTRFKVCIGIHIKYQFWFIFIFTTTLHQIHMMKNPKFLQNTIFMFLMTENVILNLFKITSNCSSNTCWIMNMHHNGIGCGVMVVQQNLKVASHGFLCQGILV